MLSAIRKSRLIAIIAAQVVIVLWPGNALALTVSAEAVMQVKSGCAPVATVIEHMHITVKPLGYKRGQTPHGEPFLEDKNGKARFDFVDMPRLETDISATLDKHKCELTVRYSERGQVGRFSNNGQVRFRRFLAAMKRSFGNDAVTVKSLPR